MKDIHTSSRRVDRCRRPSPSGGEAGFTLVELMVVVAIIGLLIAIMLPSFHSAQQKVKATATAALFQALDAGNEQFKGNGQIGGTYIPSETDSEADSGNFGMMSNPLHPRAPGLTPIGPFNGATLLVFGLIGADTFGTPGFADLSGDGYWYNDQHTQQAPPGLYRLDRTTLEPMRPRYGPFVSEKTVASVQTFQSLIDNGTIVAESFPTGAASPTGGNGNLDQPTFVDAWGQPILYYRAKRAAIHMVTNPNASPVKPGVFDHRDNGILTGNRELANGVDGGVDMGAGTKHGIRNTEYPEPQYGNVADPILEQSSYDDTFERFIWDKTVTQRNTPVNRETYLLISAGPDALYGTEDDVLNWTPR